MFGYESCLSHKYEKPTLIREKKTWQLLHIVKIRETYSNLRKNESTIVFNCSKILYHLRSIVIKHPRQVAQVYCSNNYPTYTVSKDITISKDCLCCNCSVLEMYN